jgi:GT2 family glycosyltransferase
MNTAIKPPATTVTLSLVLCTLGRTDCLWRLLQSLQMQTRTDFELVVVDQNPPGYLDIFLEAARQSLQVLHLRSVPGLSRARNVGLASARGGLLAFPDDDCWYPPDTVARVVASFAARPQAGVLTCRTVDALGQDSNGRFLQASADITRRNVWLAGNSNGLFVRAAVVQRLRGFNEALGVGSGTPFGAGEESDFLLRALAAGVAVHYLHDLHVHHDQVDTVLDAQALRRARLYARGFGRTLRLNDYPAGFALLRAVRSAAAAGLALLRLDPQRARFKFIWAAGIVRGYAARS